MMRRKAKRVISVENMVFDISTYYYILTNSVFFLGTSICEDGSSIFFCVFARIMYCEVLCLQISRWKG